jgi:methyl-accepting chemotaxis protein
MFKQVKQSIEITHEEMSERIQKIQLGIQNISKIVLDNNEVAKNIREIMTDTRNVCEKITEVSDNTARLLARSLEFGD